MLPHPGDGFGLPAGVALGGIDHQTIHARVQQGGNSLGIVPGVDARAHQIALLCVQQLQRVFLVGGVVLAEYEIHQVVVLIHDGQAVEFVFPDDIVCFLQRGFPGCGDQFFPGGHEVRHLIGGVHAGNPVIPAGDDAQQLTGCAAVVGDGHGGKTVLFLQCQHVRQRMLRRQVGGGHHKAGLVIFHPAHHFRLILNGLGTIDEADAALLGQRNGQRIVGHGLHHSGGQGHIQADGRLLEAFAVLDQRRPQRDTVGNTVFRSIAGNQKILAEGVAGFRIIVRHWVFTSCIGNEYM